MASAASQAWLLGNLQVGSVMQPRHQLPRNMVTSLFIWAKRLQIRVHAPDGQAAPCAGFGSSTAQGEATREEGDEDGGAGDEEECSAEFKPVVQLDEVEVQVS